MTASRPTLTAYCLDWHIHTSSAFTELLVKPLAPYADIRLVAWDGAQDLPAPDHAMPTLFCQLPPTATWLDRYPHAPVVWIPMADSAGYPPNMKQHPAVRVVAFSQMTAQWARELGVPHCRITYAVNPTHYPPADFSGERVLLYWNRTGLFHRALLTRLCKALQVDTLIFRSANDPRVHPRHFYTLPERLGDTRVEHHPTLTSHDAYLQLLRRANIFIAPRDREGVGIAFLEAMASGMCVLAYDDTTMNDYIQHNYNGYLLSHASGLALLRFVNWVGYRLFQLFYRRWAWYVQKRHAIYPPISIFQDWHALSQVDIATLGANARQTMADGYAQWQASIPAYAHFVLKGDAP